MKKVILTVAAIFAFGFANAQDKSMSFGVKGGLNMATTTAEDAKSLLAFHVGGFAEFMLSEKFAVQPELLYSSQGAKVEGSDDIKLNYVSVPVLAKFYVLPSILSLDAGPQFSFLVNDNLDSAVESKSFDMAVAGGLGVNLGKTFFAQARYVVGLTETTKDSGAKNNVFQLSVGYFF